MKKLTMAIAATALMVAMAFTANAQTQQPGAASLHGLAQNATPITKAACGHPGRWCGAGSHRVCNRHHCWCAAC